MTTMKVTKLCDLFLHHCTRQECAEATLAHYAGRLKRFRAEFGDREVDSVGREEVLEHFLTSGEGLSSSTRRSNIVAVQRVQRYGVKFGHLQSLWFQNDDIRKPRQGMREKVLDPQQTLAVLGEMREDAQPIYRSLRLTGARPGELCGATIADMRGGPGRRAIVLAKHKTARKTGKPRWIVLNAAAEAIAMESIGERTEGPIFRTARGNQWRRDRLSREFRRCRNKLGISKSIVLYSARHEAATQIVRTHGVAHAKEILGHTDIKTTQRYTHLEEDDLRFAVNSISDLVPAKAA